MYIKNLIKRTLERAGAIIILISLLSSCEQCPAFAEPITLKASWYSTQSLHKDGQWKITHGRMSNGEYFDDNLLVCATRLYPIGAWLRITNIQNGKTVDVRVADRIGKRFAKTRIDLPKGIFAKIADCKQGIISVMVKKL